MTEPLRQEVILTKVLDAPRELVFAAFTEADRLVRWWGPEPFDIARAVSDPRPGGEYTIVMRSPEGEELPTVGTFTEIDPPRRFSTTVRAIGPDGRDLIESVTTVELTEIDGKTEVTLRAAAVALVPDADPMLAGMELGWIQTLRGLEDHVTGTADRQIVLTRLLEGASPAAVFDAWVVPEQLAVWSGPDATAIAIEETDPRARIVAARDGDPPTRLTVTIDPYVGNTVLTVRVVFRSEADRDAAVQGGAIEDEDRMLDRLVAFVAGR